MEETTALFKRLVIFLWIYLLFFGVDCGQEKEVACTSKSIRNDVSKFKILENCTIIEGFLHIVLIERVMEADFAKLSFPKLVEITGHMLLYRVDGLRTLRHIFPNLAVIRGQELFHNYALAAYQMQDLEELGLVSLTAIKRGAVRLEKNSKLCYVDTIDWGKLAASDNWKDNVFLENKDEQECVNICPDSCSRSTVDGKEAKRCWNSKDCQKGLNCGCGKGIFCNDVTGECCHHYCMGGCRAPGKDNCLACKAVIYNGICEPRCNPETYKYMDRRCLLDRECMNMENHQKEEWKIIRGESGKDGEKEGKCIKECPNGYTKNTTTPNIRECTKCSAHCPKVCHGRVIDSIDAAQTLTGCTSIMGPLEIEIDGGSNIVAELEKSLGEIETVSYYIKITRSYPIISLHFFKKLKVINGEKLDQSYYSLNIFDNPNLQELFSPEVTKNLKIKNGKTKFNFNRKLCFYKIENFLNEVGLANDTDGLDDVKNTNGDSIPCEVNTLNLSVQDVSHHSVFLKWDQFKTHDMRPLLSYVVHYREVQSKNVNIFQGRDACSESVWKTKEVEPDKNSNPEEFISSLRPWTLYAAYIQTYTIGRASSSAISNLTYFRTKPYYPSAPTNLEITAEIEGELKVTWDPPKLPNGNVTYYIVRWRRQLLKREEFDKRDYCVEPLDLNRDKKEKDKKKEEAKKNLTLPSGGQCCRCPKTPQEEEEENRIRLNEIAFENALHDEVYVKRSENDMGYRRKREVPSQNDIQTGKQRYMFGNTDDEDIDVKRLRGKVDGKNSSSSNDTEETVQENKSIVRSQEIHLPNLGHSQPYTVEVVACLSDKDKHGKDMCSHSHSQGNSAIANARTLASKTADTINASTISIKVNRTEVKLKWAEPKKPNGLIIKFEINYKKVHINDEYRPAFCINYTKYHSIHGYKLEKLQPGNYSFQIRATSLAGPGEWTPIKYFFIEDFGNGSRIDQKVIIAIVIGVILVIVITIIVVWFVAKNRFAKESELANNLIVSHNPNYFPAGDVYIPDGWEVDRDKIELIREIGEGSFGMVYEGIASDIPPFKGPMNIAIKTVNDQANVQDKMNFLKEACIMKAFSCYHVVKLLGVVSQGQPAYVIMELMKNGDLKNYLRSHRPDVEDNNGAPPPTLKEILQMSGEIADGMAYLADKKFVHRDLAARNCMVAEDNTVKIGDFGMTRDIYMTDYYRKGGKGLLPVRWMAPESLKDGIFTTMSDVWSYGVVLWEMATLAAQPYQGLSNEEVLRYVSEGKFMEKPEGCPDRLYDLMLKCWQYKDKNRPTFKEIIEMLVPDLHPSFKDVSYFFSDENKPPDGPEFNDVMEEDLEDIDIDTYQGDIEHPNYFNLQDESTIPFIEDCDKDEGNTSPSRKIRPSTSGPCECVMLEELGDVKTHRASNCSSQNSALGNSDGSKESSKSSDGSYTQRNGLANGHIHLRLPRTTTC